MLTVYGADLSAPANKVRFTANILGLAGGSCDSNFHAFVCHFFSPLIN